MELDEELLGGLGRGGFLAGEIGGAGIGEIVVERHGGRVQNGVGGGGGVEKQEVHYLSPAKLLPVLQHPQGKGQLALAKGTE